MLPLKECGKKFYFEKSNYITSNYLELFRSSCPKPSGVVKTFFWLNYRLTVQSSNCIMQLLHQVQKQPSTVIHFRKFLQEIPVVESFFWSNYRLTVQSGHYILKWLHQKYFLENLPLGLFRSSCPQPSISETFSRKYRW